MSIHTAGELREVEKFRQDLEEQLYDDGFTPEMANKASWVAVDLVINKYDELVRA